MATNRLASRMKKVSNLTRTENDALTYKSTTNDVLDFFYLAPTRQGQDNVDLFIPAWEDNPALALKAAFYLRDVRGGKGQRKTFRDILDWLARYKKSVFNAVVPYVAEYGRWDDLLRFVTFKSVQVLVSRQLADDLKNEHPSLLAKWMPSENASSKDSRELARAWMEVLGYTPRAYRRMLSLLRSRIDVVERKMSNQDWNEINYSGVPSRAMKLYRKAFEAHDEDRFDAFIQKAKTGEVKIQSKTLYPHELVAPFLHGTRTDEVLEAQWNQLPNYFGEKERNILVVVDTSSSMFCPVGNGKTQAMDVSVSLGLYCAERNRGDFHNIIMTFNSRPEIVHITAKGLGARVRQVHDIPWGGSTNLQGTFEALLRFAKVEKVPAKDMPTNIVIITDGEFNRQVDDRTNLDGIKAQYKAAGYKVPILTFWNCNSRHNQVPATKNEKNVFLVSGFSAETIGSVLNMEDIPEKTPEQLMLQVLNSERYAFVDELGL